MSVKYGVKPNWLVIILSVVFLIIGALGIVFGAMLLAAPHMANSALLALYGYVKSEYTAMAVILLIEGILLVIAAISGFRGKFFVGKLFAWITLVFSVIFCIVLLAGGAHGNVLWQFATGVIVPILWLIGCRMSDKKVHIKG